MIATAPAGEGAGGATGGTAGRPSRLVALRSAWEGDELLGAHGPQPLALGEVECSRAPTCSISGTP